MASVTFPPAIGGDGSTVTDDSSITTGLANGGHRTRFVPALAQVVAVAGYAVASATDVASNAAISTAAATTINAAWLGGKATDPTLDNNGNALVNGTSYFNTSTGKIRVYYAPAWQDAFATLAISQDYKVATAGQTVFSIGFTYTIGINAMTVYVNGVRQAVGINYSETSTNSVTFSSGLVAGDEVLFIIYSTYSIGFGAASNISVTTIPGLVATNVQEALAEISADSQSFDVSGTWTKPNGARFVRVEGWGAGGGGGAGFSGGAGASGGGGGGGGSYVCREFLASDLPASVTVTVAAGGSGSGGSSSFGALLTAYGGAAGATGTATGGAAGGSGGGTLSAGTLSAGGAPFMVDNSAVALKVQNFGGGLGGAAANAGNPSGFGGAGGGGASQGSNNANYPGGCSYQGGAGGGPGGSPGRSAGAGGSITGVSGGGGAAGTFSSVSGVAGATRRGGGGGFCRYLASSYIKTGIAAAGAVVAVATSNQVVLTSATGVGSYTPYVTPNAGLQFITSDGTLFALTDLVGNITYTTTDFSTWTLKTGYLNFYLSNFKYVNGVYFALGGNGELATSTDLTTWTTRSSGVFTALNDVAWDGTRYIIVGDSAVSLTSTNLSTWTNVSTGTGNNWRVAATASAIVVSTSITPIRRSVDGGATWANPATPPTGVNARLGHGNSLFVAGTASGGIFTSSDGNTWASTSATPTTSLGQFVWNGTVYATTDGAVNANAAFTAPAGATTWTTRTATTLAENGGAGGDGGFPAGGGGGGAAGFSPALAGAGGVGGNGRVIVYTW